MPEPSPSHIDTFFDDPYIKAGHVAGADRTVTITKVDRGLVGSDNDKQVRPIISFHEFPKPMVLNKTNAKRIRALYGPDTAAWLGKRITLYATTCDAFGEEVDCIRVRKEPPPNGQV